MSRLAPLSCREVVELVTDYIEGNLSWWDRRRFKLHLRTCKACRRYLDQMRETIRLLGRLEEQDLPDEAREGLLQAFRNWPRP